MEIDLIPNPSPWNGDGNIGVSINLNRLKNNHQQMISPVRTARELRRQMTWEEILLWQELRGRRFKGYKFRRQHPIVYQVINKRKYFYVADFYCASRKIVIELDGKIHEFEEQKMYDIARDKLMKEMGIKTVRIQNNELNKMNEVLIKIENFLI